MNNMKTFLLLSALTALLIVIGGLIGGKGGIIIALVLAGLMNMGAYWYSDKIVLHMYNTREVNHDNTSGLYGIVQNLAKKASLPMPKIYLIDSDAPNAFATGRNPQKASVAATTGLINR